ncbi:MAG: DUF2007 domain-containing protein [Dehalococcoidia bacterium]
MRWLREFLRERDPLARVASALTEPEALMWRELLENNGVPAMVKNVNALSVTQSFPTPFGDYDLYVKQGDLERAEEVLGPMLDSRQRPAQRYTRREE